jgi:uncharacterized protein (TIGR02145 family)
LPKPPEHGTFTDPRDGRTYKTAKIGKQIWLAENLAFDYAGSKVYGNDLANLAKYGRLYDWETAKKACPPGWHLPTNKEWQELVDFASCYTGKFKELRDDSEAGKHLKATSGWKENGNGTDAFGFSALPGGYGYSSGYFYNVGDGGYWWSASEYSSYDAYYRDMNYDYEYAFWFNYGKSSLFSVRGLQDTGAAE